MPRAITPHSRHEYVCKADRNLNADDPDRTVFICRQLSGRDMLSLRRSAANVSQEATPDGAVARIRHRMAHYLEFGLVGWRNLRGHDESGELVAVPFPDKVEGQDPEDRPWWDLLDGDTVEELATFIMRGCTMLPEDAGKSEGPSDTQPEPAAPAQPAEK